MSGHNAYRDGRVLVCERRCDTRVFRPGNLMHLEPGRLADLIARALADDSTSTIYRDDVNNAVCRGFYDRHPPQPLQAAQRLGLIRFDTAEGL